MRLPRDEQQNVIDADERCPTRRAPNGWDSPHFLGIVLSFGTPLRGSLFPSLSLPSRR